MLQTLFGALCLTLLWVEAHEAGTWALLRNRVYPPLCAPSQTGMNMMMMMMMMMKDGV